MVIKIFVSYLFAENTELQERVDVWMDGSRMDARTDRQLWVKFCVTHCG